MIALVNTEAPILGFRVYGLGFFKASVEASYGSFRKSGYLTLGSLIRVLLFNVLY